METEHVFDFTEQREQPFELFPEPGPSHPPMILARSEPLMAMRFRQIPD